MLGARPRGLFVLVLPALLPVC
eukprot:COSAG01_NODE_67311_length_267_cov_0.928571_1_plen_21_part_01